MSENVNLSLDRNRMLYPDLIKIIAIFMVLFNHRSTYTLAANCVGYGFKPFIIQILATLCRCGVPLFFMASGVLLLRKDETFRYILVHRVTRIVVVMMICTFIKIWGNISFWNFIDAFFTKLNWYLYAYFDYLLMLPFLRLISLNANKGQIRIWIILVSTFYGLGGFLIFFNYYTGFIDFAPIYNTQFSSLSWGIIFALTGYFIVSGNLKSKQSILFFLVGTVVSIALSVVFVMKEISVDNGANIDQLRLHFIYFPCCLIFVFSKILCEQVRIFKKEFVRRCIVTVSGTTFGIFIIETHSELINYVNWKLSISHCFGYMGDYFRGGVSIIAQFIICFFIVCVLKKMPFLKKIL